MPYAELLSLARDVAEEAAELIRSRRLAGVAVSETKSSAVDIVTEVDKAAERLIYQRLLDARPEDGFLGEEGSAAESVTGVTWVVDPIDGTVNFFYGIPHYSVSIAATVAGEAVAGVVVNVATRERFEATRGGGATCDGEPMSVRPRAPLAERLVLTGFSYVAETRRRQAAAAAALLPQVRDIRRLGSAALDLCAIGAGRADGYVEEGLHFWDRAAGALVASEAGAVVEIHPGVGGRDCVVCAPRDGYQEFFDTVVGCGFLLDQEADQEADREAE